jgi:hypothetical protein
VFDLFLAASPVDLDSQPYLRNKKWGTRAENSKKKGRKRKEKMRQTFFEKVRQEKKK